MKQGVVSTPKKGWAKNDQIIFKVLEFVMQGKGDVVSKNIEIGEIVLNHEFDYTRAFLPV